jgi:hypothetical protein
MSALLATDASALIDSRYRRRFLKGPLPKDYALPYPHPLNVNHLDARQFGPQAWAGLSAWIRIGALCFPVFTGATLFVALSVVSVLPKTVENVLIPLSVPAVLALITFMLRRAHKRRGFVPSAVVFDREHGQVVFRARGRRPERRYPFAWAQGYMGSLTTRSGLQKKLLEVQIIDPASGKTLERLTGGLGPTVQEYDVLALWSFLCQYMDKSKALPRKAELISVIAAERYPHFDAEPTPQSREFVSRVMSEAAVEAEAISLPMDYSGMEPVNPFHPEHPYPENAARVIELRAQYERTMREVLDAIDA